MLEQVLQPLASAALESGRRRRFGPHADRITADSYRITAVNTQLRLHRDGSS